MRTDMLKLYYARHLRAGFAYRPGGGRHCLHGGASRLQEQPADQPALSRDQSEGARACAGDGPRHPDRNAGDPGLHRAEAFRRRSWLPDDPFVFAQAQSFNSYLCSTVHINHAHKMRGHRWATDESSFADMKRKVPETMAACFALIERDMLEGAVRDGRAVHRSATPICLRSRLARRRRRRSRARCRRSRDHLQADVGAAGGAKVLAAAEGLSLPIAWAPRAAPSNRDGPPTCVAHGGHGARAFAHPSHLHPAHAFPAPSRGRCRA